MSTNDAMHELSYILNHLGEDRADYFNAVSPPLIQTSNFSFKRVADFRQALQDEYTHTIYSRGQNPTLRMLHQKLAALDGAEDALCFASGVAAISAAIINSVKAGEHVICVNQCYGWTRHLLMHHMAKYGVETTFVDGREVENFRLAIQPNTRLIVLESPTSFQFQLQDLAAVAALARQHGIRTLLDNSYAGPLNPTPLALGIDLLAYSGTKYHGGHSDVVSGVLTGSHAIIRDIYDHEYMTLGGMAPPMHAWLMLRSLRTLHLRMERAASSTPQVVNFLAQHPKVARIIYPHHPSHPQHALALRQHPQPTGLFSIQLTTDSVAQVEQFVERLQYFMMAVSWGGHESLVIPACIFNAPADSPLYLPPNMLRFYIGLEDPQVLIADLAQALDTLA